MQKVLISVNEALLNRIDGTLDLWGFASRSEFFRYAAIDFLRHEAGVMPADDMLRDHTVAIRSVKARRHLAEASKAFYRPNRQPPITGV